MRLALASLVLLAACVPLPRDPACVDADVCDRALERPFGDFGADDPVFGELGTCWQNAETQKPCIAGCQAFLAEQVDKALTQGNQSVVDACSGVAAEE